MTPLASAVLDHIGDGVSLLAISRIEGMPGRRTVYDWIEHDAEFAAQFRARKALGVHALVDQCLDIADEKAGDAVQVADKRVRIDTRLRLAGKWLPKEYGDKIDINHGGQVAVRHDLSSYSASDLDALEGLVSKGAIVDGNPSRESPALPDIVR